jgi:hypothetical protein
MKSLLGSEVLEFIKACDQLLLTDKVVGYVGKVGNLSHFSSHPKFSSVFRIRIRTFY